MGSELNYPELFKGIILIVINSYKTESYNTSLYNSIKSLSIKSLKDYGSEIDLKKYIYTFLNGKRNVKW